MVWESLIREGIQVVFGIPGGAVIPLYHFMVDYPIRHVLMRHEQAAIHAADGYARATGRTGVCLVTSGPGATNLVSGLATAQMAGSAVVAITGQTSASMLGTDAFQEVDIVSITSAVTKHNYLVTAVQDLPRVIKEAFYIARSGEPGPVLIAIAADAQLGEAIYVPPSEVCLPGYRPVEQVASVAEGHSHAEPAPGSAAVDPDRRMVEVLLDQLGQIGHGGPVVVADLEGEMQTLIARRLRTLLTAGKTGTRGFALPAAIGALIGLPDRPVWAITGDDSFQANIQELATVAQEHVPLKIVVLVQRDGPGADPDRPGPSGKRSFSSRLPGPDLVKLAEAYGLDSAVVRDRQECAAVISRAEASGEPMLIEFRRAVGYDRLE
jgi:thiamine pyrophosphate-dependent acetolactate synthase large subunit-like protein